MGFTSAFLTLALIYFAVFVCVNIAVSIKSVLRDSRLLVTIVILLAIVGFIQYLSDRSLSWHRFDLFFISIVWLVFLGFFLKNMLSTRKNQAKSNADQNAG
jgi:Ca2+/Na+ antiporter